MTLVIGLVLAPWLAAVVLVAYEIIAVRCAKREGDVHGR